MTATLIPATSAIPGTVAIYTPIRALKEIDAKFADWKDPLSQKLHRTIKRVEETNLQWFILTIFTKILVNPLYESLLLQEPLLDRIWVWERRFLEEYQTIARGTLSPFDKEPIVAKVHDFAIEILKWAKLNSSELDVLRTPLDDTDSQAIEISDTRLAATPMKAEELAELYNILAQRFIQSEWLRSSIKLRTKSARVLSLKADEENAGTLILQKENHQAMLTLKDTMASTGSEMTAGLRRVETVHALREADSKQHYAKEQERLEAMKKTSEAQCKQIEDLRRQLTGMR